MLTLFHFSNISLNGLWTRSCLFWMLVLIVHSYQSRVFSVVESWKSSLRGHISSPQSVVGVDAAYVIVSRLGAYHLGSRSIYQMWRWPEVCPTISRVNGMFLSFYASAHCTPGSPGVRMYPNPPDVRKHDGAIWSLMYDYSARHDRLFAGDRGWSSSSLALTRNIISERIRWRKVGRFPSIHILDWPKRVSNCRGL